MSLSKLWYCNEHTVGWRSTEFGFDPLNWLGRRSVYFQSNGNPIFLEIQGGTTPRCYHCLLHLSVSFSKPMDRKNTGISVLLNGFLKILYLERAQFRSLNKECLQSLVSISNYSENFKSIFQQHMVNLCLSSLPYFSFQKDIQGGSFSFPPSFKKYYINLTMVVA